MLDFVLLLGLCACIHSPALLQDIEEDNLQFWERSQTSLDKLYLPALRAQSVPASSVAVERVFIQSGRDHFVAT